MRLLERDAVLPPGRHRATSPDIFLVVTVRGGEDAECHWHKMGEPGVLLNTPQCAGQPPPNQELADPKRQQC